MLVNRAYAGALGDDGTEPVLEAAACSIISPPTEKPIPPMRPFFASGRRCSQATAASISFVRGPVEEVRFALAPVVAARVEQEHAEPWRMSISVPAAASLAGSGTR